MVVYNERTLFTRIKWLEIANAVGYWQKSHSVEHNSVSKIWTMEIIDTITERDKKLKVEVHLEKMT